MRDAFLEIHGTEKSIRPVFSKFETQLDLLRQEWGISSSPATSAQDPSESEETAEVSNKSDDSSDW